MNTTPQSDRSHDVTDLSPQSGAPAPSPDSVGSSPRPGPSQLGNEETGRKPMHASIAMTPDPAALNGAPAPAPDTRLQHRTASKSDASAAETLQAISDLVFNLEDPINGAHAATQALQDLAEEPIGEREQRAVFELVCTIMGEINTLTAQFNVLFKATRMPRAADTAVGNGAPKPSGVRKWKLSEAQEREHRDMIELPFVHQEANGDIVSWRPPEIPLAENKQHAAYAVGTHYALLTIDHLRRHGGKVDVAPLLNNVASAIAERGAEKWGSIETSFFYVLGEYISRREVTVGDSFDATYIGDREAAE